MNQHAQFFPLCDRQPTQVSQSGGNMITRPQLKHESSSSVNDSLERGQRRRWQPCEHCVTVAQTWKNECWDESGSYIATKLMSYGSQSSKMIEACLRNLADKLAARALTAVHRKELKGHGRPAWMSPHSGLCVCLRVWRHLSEVDRCAKPEQFGLVIIQLQTPWWAHGADLDRASFLRSDDRWDVNQFPVFPCSSSCISSAYWWCSKPYFSNKFANSSAYRIKNLGPRIDPCGTTNSSVVSLESPVFTETTCLRSLRKSTIKSSARPCIPNRFFRTSARMLWSTVSKAADRSIGLEIFIWSPCPLDYGPDLAYEIS